MITGFLTNKITLADNTELEGKYAIVSNGFLTVYDAPGDTHYFIYSASQVKTIEVGEAEEEPDADPADDSEDLSEG